MYTGLIFGLPSSSIFPAAGIVQLRDLVTHVVADCWNLVLRWSATSLATNSRLSQASAAARDSSTGTIMLLGVADSRHGVQIWLVQRVGPGSGRHQLIVADQI